MHRHNVLSTAKTVQTAHFSNYTSQISFHFSAYSAKPYDNYPIWCCNGLFFFGLGARPKFPGMCVWFK